MRRVTKTTAVVVLLALTGCGGSSDSATPGEVPPPATSAPGPEGPSPVLEAAAKREQIEQQVLAAYLASWEAWDAASDPADPDHPALAETHSGPALTAAAEQLEAWKATGRVVKYPDNSITEYRPEVASLDGDEALVRDCNIDDTQIVIAATGEIVNDQVVSTLAEASMVMEDGRWKLRSLKVVESWEGVAGCAA